MKWTTEQEKAIATRHKNLLVSAAAGSGKTALLIERIRRMVVDEQIPVDSLLILTFTRAAAGEMKERLTAAFTESLRQTDPQDRERVHWLVEQMQILPTASIDTFDAFCSRVVREYFQEVDVDPDYRIGDATELTMLYTQAQDEVFEAAYQQIPEDGGTAFSRLIDCYTTARSDQGLKDQVERLRHFLNALPDPEAWCRDAIADLKQSGSDFEHSKWYKVLASKCAEDLSAAEAELDQGLSIIEGDADFVKTEAQLKAEKAMIEGVHRTLDTEDWSTFRAALMAADYDRYKGSRKNKEDSDRVKAHRNRAKDIVKKGLQADLAQDPEDEQAEVEAMAEVMTDLIALTKAVEDRFTALKRERGLLDFADVDRYAYRILKEPNIAKTFQENYEAVFVDEYQDTNALQEGIIAQILRPDNYFMVGDVKQSIYRFRQADPSIFIDKYNAYATDGGGINQLITLGKNFRSDKGVVDSVNALFERIMSPTFGQIAYDDKARLVQGAESAGPAAPTVVRIFEAPSGDRLEREGAWIADQIDRSVGHPITIAKTGETRNLRYRDIAILMRSTGDGRGEQIAQMLSDKGIPAYYEGGASYFSTPEIEWVLDLIRIVDNYRQDMPLMTVMLSPIGGFSADEMAQIRIASEDKTFYECVDAVSAQGTPLGMKVKRWLGQLGKWRTLAYGAEVSDFLWQLYTETGFYIWAGSLPGGAQRQKNLDALIDKAQDYQSSTLHGIFRFVDYVEQVQKRTDGSEAPGILSENDDVVRIMTIHKSKGLEFPVVFLADTAHQFNQTDSTASIILDKDLGISPEYIDGEKRIRRKTMVHQIAAYKNKMDNLAEEMRLLYVAMTRAMERLVITGGVSNLEKAEKKWDNPCDVSRLKACRSPLDWIMLALYSPNSAGGADSAAFKIITGGDEEAETPADVRPAAPEAACSEEDLAEIDRRMAWRYPKKSGRRLPSKISVTEVEALRQQDHPREKIVERQPVPDFLRGAEDQPPAFTAAELGTGVHTVLRHLNLEKLREIPDDEMQAVVKTEGETMAERGQIDEALFEATIKNGGLAHAAAFMTSDLGRRMAAASRVEREWPFDLEMPSEKIAPDLAEPSVLLQGMIDCCFLEERGGEKGWILLDYKTDRWQNREIGRQKSVQKYKTQIEIYRQALEALTPYPVWESYLCFLTMETCIKIG